MLPKTGQTSCWDSGGNAVACTGTGKDGDVQAGVPVKYVDGGNGTITDQVTNLTWEKKSKDGTFNDFRLIYTWDDAFRVHVATLNAQRFGGYNDWRLPNIRELLSLVNYQSTGNTAFSQSSIPRRAWTPQASLLCSRAIARLLAEPCTGRQRQALARRRRMRGSLSHKTGGRRDRQRVSPTLLERSEEESHVIEPSPERQHAVDRPGVSDPP